MIEILHCNTVLLRKHSLFLGTFLRDCLCLQMNAIQGGSISSICGDLLSVIVLMLHLEDYTLLWTVLILNMYGPSFDRLSV